MPTPDGHPVFLIFPSGRHEAEVGYVLELTQVMSAIYGAKMVPIAEPTVVQMSPVTLTPTRGSLNFLIELVEGSTA